MRKAGQQPSDSHTRSSCHLQECQAQIGSFAASCKHLHACDTHACRHTQHAQMPHQTHMHVNARMLRGTLAGKWANASQALYRDAFFTTQLLNIHTIYVEPLPCFGNRCILFPLPLFCPLSCACVIDFGLAACQYEFRCH